MRKAKAEKSSSKTVKLLNIVTVFVALFVLIMMIHMIGELRGAFARDPYSSMEYSLQSGDYAYMVRNYYYRNYDIAPFDSAYAEEYHVAEYADAAFRYQFFSAAGNEVMARRLAERMQTAREGCGSLQVATDDIDRLLGQIKLFP